MPTLSDNIEYIYRCKVDPNRASIVHLVKSLLVLVLVAVALEVFVFNFNYFASAGYKSIDLKDRIELPKGDDGYFRATSVSHVLEFSNLNAEVRNIRIDFDSNQPAQNLTVKIHFTDDAHRAYFDSTEYTVGVPEVEISTMSSQSEYINLNTAGYVSSLRIEITGDDVSYPIKLKTVTVNACHPFEFSWLRFTVALGVLLLAFMFRPRSSVYRINMVTNPVKSKAGIVATVVIEIALVSTFLFYGSNLVGVATSSYNYGSWDGKSIVNTFEVGGGERAAVRRARPRHGARSAVSRGGAARLA